MSRNRQQNNSLSKNVANIATIISTVVTCIKIASYGYISAETAALIMLGVVVLVAVGNTAAKIILATAALILFVLLNAHGNKAEFLKIMQLMTALIIMLIGVYIIIRGVFMK